jgi:hypothetical protein
MTSFKWLNRAAPEAAGGDDGELDDAAAEKKLQRVS